MSRMHVSVESKETPLNFTSGPCAFDGPLTTKSTSPRPATATDKDTIPSDACFDPYSAPAPAAPITQKDTLNIFSDKKENIAPTPSRCRDPNVESTEIAQTHSKCSGVKRIEPVVHTDAPQGLKVVDAPNSSRFRTVTIVGEGAIATSPAPTSRVATPRPNSASTPMGTVLTMDQALINHTAPVDVVGRSVSRQRSASLPAGAKRSRDLSHVEKIVLDATTNIAARHGSLANFFFHLARGTVGHIGTLEQAQGSKIPIETLREQLCAVVTMDIDMDTMNHIFFGEQTENIPKFVTFADFTQAFPDAR